MLQITQVPANVTCVDEAAALGARIRALRERVGIQSQLVAGRLGIDPSAMSNIERGKRAVKSDELAIIASVLGVSPLAILSKDSLLGRLPIAPRLQEAPATEGAAVARLTALAELNEVLAEGGLPPTPLLEGVPSADTYRWLQSADELASWARDRIPVSQDQSDRLSALADGIESRLGVDVLVESYPVDDFAGASITDWAFPFILVNRQQPTTRALFTLAHELAHVLSRQGAILTLDVNLIAKSNWERFANAFAASFLMPEARVREIVVASGRTVGALAAMLIEFGVSFESLVYRLHNLGLINARGRDQLRARGWTGVLIELDHDERRRALIDSMGSRPERRSPGPLADRAFRGYQQGVISVRPLATLLGVDEDVLLDKLVREQDSRDVLNDQFIGEPLSAEERYSGNPV